MGSSFVFLVHKRGSPTFVRIAHVSNPSGCAFRFGSNFEDKLSACAWRAWCSHTCNLPTTHRTMDVLSNPPDEHVPLRATTVLRTDGTLSFSLNAREPLDGCRLHIRFIFWMVRYPGSMVQLNRATCPIDWDNPPGGFTIVPFSCKLGLRSSIHNRQCAADAMLHDTSAFALSAALLALLGGSAGAVGCNTCHLNNDYGDYGQGGFGTTKETATPTDFPSGSHCSQYKSASCCTVEVANK